VVVIIQVASLQDAEKRILNGKSQLEEAKTPLFSHLPFSIRYWAGTLSAAR